MKKITGKNAAAFLTSEMQSNHVRLLKKDNTDKLWSFKISGGKIL